jgi:hypothetical protein
MSVRDEVDHIIFVQEGDLGTRYNQVRRGWQTLQGHEAPDVPNLSAGLSLAFRSNRFVNREVF